MICASQHLPLRSSHFRIDKRQSIFSQEGIPLTMQVGMLACDGIIIASDTQATHLPKQLSEGQVGQAIRYHTSHTKIKTGTEMFVSYAQDMKTGESVANAILSSFTSNDPQEAIERISASIPEKERHNVQGLIAVPPYQLFRFQLAVIDGEWTPTCTPVLGIDFAGDMTNAAIYWCSRYHDETITVEQLLPLAAYMISCSHHMNTAGIGGLEIVTCDTTGINYVSRERILELRRKANEIDKDIRQMIFG